MVGNARGMKPTQGEEGGGGMVRSLGGVDDTIRVTWSAAQRKPEY